MSEQEDPKIVVGENYYVNEATLELLQRRIESQALGNLVKRVGFPLGAAGVLSLLWGLLVVVPTETKKFIEKSPVVQRTLETTVNNYFSSEQGQNNVEAQLKTFLDSKEGQEFLTRRINEALAPAAKKLSQRIESGSTRLVSDVELFPEIGSFEKRAPDYIDNILNSDEANRLLEKKANIALRFPVNQGKVYNPYAVNQYLFKFNSKYAERFNALLIVEKDGKSFIASIPPKLLLSSEQSDSDKIIQFTQLLTSTGNTDFFKQRLSLLFDRSVTEFVSNEGTVKDALTKPVWLNYQNLTDRVSVVNKDNIYIGTTTREKLIHGILQKQGD
jgi:hypothetical protein